MHTLEDRVGPCALDDLEVAAPWSGCEAHQMDACRRSAGEEVARTSAAAADSPAVVEDIGLEVVGVLARAHRLLAVVDRTHRTIGCLVARWSRDTHCARAQTPGLEHALG
jgi:hypothetical protein